MPTTNLTCLVSPEDAMADPDKAMEGKATDTEDTEAADAGEKETGLPETVTNPLGHCRDKANR